MPRLTLNLGVRYSFFAQPTDSNGLLNNFDPATFNAATAQTVSSTGVLCITGVAACANTNGLNSGVANPNGDPHRRRHPGHARQLRPRLTLRLQGRHRAKKVTSPRASASRMTSSATAKPPSAAASALPMTSLRFTPTRMTASATSPFVSVPYHSGHVPGQSRRGHRFRCHRACPACRASPSTIRRRTPCSTR